ncbi:MAG: hypothetical protein HY900_20785 [Deltaproteobacteria bacterium]|nr:hypothetical protein [Deltaproteobacteria bacterium]
MGRIWGCGAPVIGYGAFAILAEARGAPAETCEEMNRGTGTTQSGTVKSKTHDDLSSWSMQDLLFGKSILALV